MEFKDNLYQMRKEKGYSQDQLAQLCEVSRQAISKWENGSANPDLNNLTQLSKVLDVSVDVLLGNKVRDERYDRRRYTKEYVSKRKLFGIPLVHVNVGRGRGHVAKGIIAIGNTSIGVVSIGLMSAGFFSFGILTLGVLFGVGVLALSYFALGALSIGYIAIGAFAIGAYSIGAISIGYVLSIGAVSCGITAIGPIHSTYGETIYHIRNAQDCIIEGSSFDQLQQYLQNTKMPFIIRIIVEHFTQCL